MAHFNSESKAALNSDHNRETVAIKQMDLSSLTRALPITNSSLSLHWLKSVQTSIFLALGKPCISPKLWCSAWEDNCWRQ